MTKAELIICRKSIRILKVQYQANLFNIQVFERKNEIIMQEVFSKIDQFEKESEDPNKGMFDNTDYPG